MLITTDAVGGYIFCAIMACNERRRKVLKISKWIIVILIVFLAVNIKTSIDIVSMKNEISNLKNSVNSMSSSTGGAVSSSIYQIEQALKKENSLVNEFKYEFVELKDKESHFLLTLKPRVYNKGEEVFFLLKTGSKDPELIPAETSDNLVFTANINVSVFDSSEIDLVVVTGDTNKTEKLDRISSTVEKFAADIQAQPIGGVIRTLKGEGVLFINYDYGLYYSFPYNGETISLKDINLNIELNGKVVDTMPIPEDSKGRYQHYIKLEGYKIHCKPGDSILIYATAKDNNSFNYKCYLESYVITENENGDIGYDPNFDHTKRVEIN